MKQAQAALAGSDYAGALAAFQNVVKGRPAHSQAAAGTNFARWILSGVELQQGARYGEAARVFSWAVTNLWSDRRATNAYQFCQAMAEGESSLGRAEWVQASNAFFRARACEGGRRFGIAYSASTARSGLNMDKTTGARDTGLRLVAEERQGGNWGLDPSCGHDISRKKAA